jgi:hypothetical protein
LNKATGSIRRNDLPQATIDTIIEHNQADIELYQFAQDLFERRYASMIQELLDWDYQRQYLVMELVDTCELDFAHKIPGTGWQPSEPDSPNIRWTGPGTVSTIDLALQRNKVLLMTFRIVTALDQDILDSFRVEVNQTPLPLNVEAPGALPGIRLSALLTPEMLASHQPFTRISFHVSRTVRPCDVLPDNIDERLLGVAIADFKIAPQSNRFRFR